MLIEDVKKLSPIDRMVYWIRERYQIALKRKAGKKPPWTDDEILQSYFFTHPYREMDKVTVWFKENIREPLRDNPRVIFATIAFRWFNWPPTGDRLTEGKDWDDKRNLLTNWNPEEALKRLRHARDTLNQQIFTGAFMINSPGGEKKLEAIVRRVDQVWKDRASLRQRFQGGTLSMEKAHSLLTRYEGLGGFMAYEVVCDLRYTSFLEHAPDKMTWCHVGPGATRGLSRVLGIPFEKGNNSSSPPRVPNEQEEMRKLLKVIQTRLPKMPPFEMREVEHSSCETDKYERLLWNDGRAKRLYNGRG